MKSLYLSAGLFLGVCVFVLVNFFAVKNVVDDTRNELREVPTEINFYENMDENAERKIYDILLKIGEEWRKNENFLCASLEHKISRDFLKEIVCAKAYFKNKEYNDFIAAISCAKDILEHIEYDEGIKLGNVL